MSKCIAIVPARGGSKRIPHKNIIDFCGRPLITYSLEAARKSGLFDVIHVSTDDDEIRAVTEDFGLSVDFMRDPALADDFTGVRPVMQAVLREYDRRGHSFDDVCLLMPTSPLIDAEDLITGYDAFRANGRERYVVAVAPFNAPVEWAFTLGEDKALTPREPGMFEVRSQDIEQTFYDAGAYCYFPAKPVMDGTLAADDKFSGVVLPAHKAIDIDDPEHLELAKRIYLGGQALATGTRHEDQVRKP